jgi:ribosomal protein S18 acetylase RimI-like enzyme
MESMLDADNVEIHLAQPNDLDAVRDCVIAAYSPWIDRIGRRPMPMDADYAALIRACEVYVVRGHEAIWAVLVMRPLAEALLIENIAVAPAQQKRGLGRALLRFAEQVALQHGFTSATLYTNVLMTKNIALYQRLGYIETERRSEHGFGRIFMRKSLQPVDNSGETHT